MIKNGKVIPIDVVRYRLGLAFGSATRTTAGAATNDALPARVPRTMTSPSDIPPKTASNTPIIPFIRGIAIARKISLKPIDLKSAKCLAAIIPISMRKSVSTPGTKSIKNESVDVIRVLPTITPINSPVIINAILGLRTSSNNKELRLIFIDVLFDIESAITIPTISRHAKRAAA